MERAASSQLAAQDKPSAANGAAIQYEASASGGRRRRGRLRPDLQNFRTHFLARLELHHRPLRNGNVGFGRIRISADARFADLDFKNAEVSEFDLVAFRQCFSDIIQRFLDDIQYLLLYEARLVADAGHQISLCQGHNNIMSLVYG